MPGAYSTFDTLTMELGEMGPPGMVAPSKPLPVLAQIPLVQHTSSTQHHVDPAHATAGPNVDFAPPTAVSFDVRSDAAAPISLATDLAGEPSDGGILIAPVTKPASATKPRRRIDDGESTSTSLSMVETATATTLAEPAQAPAAIAAVPDTKPASWTESLLRFESAIAPYSQIIVLITLLAAASLTLVLLRGKPTRIDSGSPTVGSKSDALAGQPEVAPSDNATLPPALGRIEFDPPTAPTESPAEKIAGAGPTTLRGPAGIIKNPTAGKPAPSIAPIQPHRESEMLASKPYASRAEPKTRVAMTPLPYPSTSPPAASAGQSAKPGSASSGSAQPRAMLGDSPLPYRQ